VSVIEVAMSRSLILNFCSNALESICNEGDRKIHVISSDKGDQRNPFRKNIDVKKKTDADISKQLQRLFRLASQIFSRNFHTVLNIAINLATVSRLSKEGRG
jgi:hypothetical protein